MQDRFAEPKNCTHTPILKLCALFTIMNFSFLETVRWRPSRVLLDFCHSIHDNCNVYKIFFLFSCENRFEYYYDAFIIIQQCDLRWMKVQSGAYSRNICWKILLRNRFQLKLLDLIFVQSKCVKFREHRLHYTRWRWFCGVQRWKTTAGFTKFELFHNGRKWLWSKFRRTKPSVRFNKYIHHIGRK